jgi:hypothetical protein
MNARGTSAISCASFSTSVVLSGNGGEGQRQITSCPPLAVVTPQHPPAVLQ